MERREFLSVSAAGILGAAVVQGNASQVASASIEPAAPNPVTLYEVTGEGFCRVQQRVVLDSQQAAEAWAAAQDREAEAMEDLADQRIPDRRLGKRRQPGYQIRPVTALFEGHYLVVEIGRGDDVYREPDHALDFNIFSHASGENTFTLSELDMTREEALESAANHNARKLAEPDGGWIVAIELGEIYKTPFGNYDMAPYGGVIDLNHEHIFRVVQPTAEEIERFCGEVNQ